MATIACVAGRSGGHIVPAMTTAHNILHNYAARGKPASLLFFSTQAVLDTELIKNYPFISVYKQLPLGSVPSLAHWYRFPLFVLQLIYSFFTSLFVLYKQRPHLLISMGGYISIPVSLAAWILGIPVTLYELNATPGRAALFLAPLARHINVVFQEARAYFNPKKCSLIKYPLRFTAPDIILPVEARYMLGVDPYRKVLLVLGGSQGSRFINKLIKDFVNGSPEKAHRLTIIHQAGAHEVADLQKFYATRDIAAFVFAYRHDINVFYSAADLIVCRAGAGTLWEIAFFKKPALVVPLEISTTMHQFANAQSMAHHYPELFTVLRQRDIKHDPTLFSDYLDKIYREQAMCP